MWILHKSVEKFSSCVLCYLWMECAVYMFNNLNQGTNVCFQQYILCMCVCLWGVSGQNHVFIRATAQGLWSPRRQIRIPTVTIHRSSLVLRRGVPCHVSMATGSLVPSMACDSKNFSLLGETTRCCARLMHGHLFRCLLGEGVSCWFWLVKNDPK